MTSGMNSGMKSGTSSGEQPPVERTEHPLTDPPQGISVDDVDRAREIRRALGDVAFPTTRNALVERARSTGSRQAVVVDLRSLPDDARFGSWEDLLVALGVGSAGRVDVPGAPPRRPHEGPPTF